MGDGERCGGGGARNDNEMRRIGAVVVGGRGAAGWQSIKLVDSFGDTRQAQLCCTLTFPRTNLYNAHTHTLTHSHTHIHIHITHTHERVILWHCPAGDKENPGVEEVGVEVGLLQSVGADQGGNVI